MPAVGSAAGGGGRLWYCLCFQCVFYRSIKRDFLFTLTFFIWKASFLEMAPSTLFQRPAGVPYFWTISLSVEGIPRALLSPPLFLLLSSCVASLPAVVCSQECSWLTSFWEVAAMLHFSNVSLLFRQQSQDGPLRWELIIFYVCLSSSKGPSPVSWFFTRYGRYCSLPLRSHQSQSHLHSLLLFFLEFSMGYLPLPLQLHRRWAGTRLTSPSWDSVVCAVATLWFFHSWW